MTNSAPRIMRGRRTRTTPAMRRLVAETRLDPSSFILPIFVKDGIEEPAPIDSMPGVAQHTTESAVALVGQAVAAGVTSFLAFGIPATKDDRGSAGWDPHGPVPRFVRAVRDVHGHDVVLLADVCLCEYTEHGHCGPVRGDGVVDNDEAVDGYVEVARTCADAGVDMVAPSGMMDGQVGAIRAALDACGHGEVGIMAYAAKYASSFYGPFRDAAESGMAFGDRAAHQMDPRNAREALREVRADLDEGADAVIVKPALPYLDVVAAARWASDVPVVGYHVSGEYSMVVAAGQRGWLDADAAMLESVVSIRRAGADAVITYAALDLARRLAG